MMVKKWYDCLEGGTLEEITDSPHEVNYSIIGKTLSFWDIDFNGNSSSLIGTWTREPYSGDCGSCDDELSKAVFTKNSLTLTKCFGEGGEYEGNDGVVIKEKAIDCGTVEITKGKETVRLTASETGLTATYNGKTCKEPSMDSFSKAQMEKACKDVRAEGYKLQRNVPGESIVEDYFKYNFGVCIENNFPEWYMWK